LWIASSNLKPIRLYPNIPPSKNLKKIGTGFFVQIQKQIVSKFLDFSKSLRRASIDAECILVKGIKSDFALKAVV
jgi:hypothetical protein